MPLSPLIQHLRDDPVGGLVTQLQQAIGSDGEHGPCVYFAATYEKLRRTRCQAKYGYNGLQTP